MTGAEMLAVLGAEQIRLAERFRQATATDASDTDYIDGMVRANAHAIAAVLLGGVPTHEATAWVRTFYCEAIDTGLTRLDQFAVRNMRQAFRRRVVAA
jgi:hypothetical protein